MNYPKLRGSLESMVYPAIAELKYDGELVFVGYNKACIALNKNGKIYSFTQLDIIYQYLTALNIKSATFIAEMYVNGGKNGELYNLMKIKSDKTRSEDLRVMIFDVIEINGQSVRNKPLSTRKEILSSLIPTGIRSEVSIVSCYDEAFLYLQESLRLGYEGCVIKSLTSQYVDGTCDWVKMKEKDQNIMRVVKVDKGERIEVINDKNVIVGVRVTTNDKEDLLVGDEVIIEHNGYLPSGSVRNPIFIERIENETVRA